MTVMQYAYLDVMAFCLVGERCFVWDDGWQPAHPADAMECRLIDRATFVEMFGELPDPPASRSR